ncbi:hypothetical protein R6Q59_023546 [Mikania micrantha]
MRLWLYEKIPEDSHSSPAMEESTRTLESDNPKLLPPSVVAGSLVNAWWKVANPIACGHVLVVPPSWPSIGEGDSSSPPKKMERLVLALPIQEDLEKSGKTCRKSLAWSDQERHGIWVSSVKKIN